MLSEREYIKQHSMMSVSKQERERVRVLERKWEGLITHYVVLDQLVPDIPHCLRMTECPRTNTSLV